MQYRPLVEFVIICIVSQKIGPVIAISKKCSSHSRMGMASLWCRSGFLSLSNSNHIMCIDWCLKPLLGFVIRTVSSIIITSPIYFGPLGRPCSLQKHNFYIAGSCALRIPLTAEHKSDYRNKRFFRIFNFYFALLVILYYNLFERGVAYGS